MKFLFQTTLLILSFCLIYVWQNSAVSSYTIPILGFLIFLYLLLSSRQKGLQFLSAKEGSVSILIVNTIIFLLVFSTGGFTSPLFFVLYFLAFGIAVVFEPLTVFVFMTGTILIFLPTALVGDTTGNLLRVGSVALISPLAYFFGKAFKRPHSEQKKPENPANAISNSAGHILKTDKNNLKEEPSKDFYHVLEEKERSRHT